MLFSIYTRLDASSPLRSGCVSGSWFGTHHYRITCLGVLSTIGGRCRLYALGSCSLRTPQMFFFWRGPLLGLSYGTHLANGPTAHSTTIYTNKKEEKKSDERAIHQLTLAKMDPSIFFDFENLGFACHNYRLIALLSKIMPRQQVRANYTYPRCHVSCATYIEIVHVIFSPKKPLFNIFAPCII